MPIARKFLDWTRPALPAIADWLADQYESAGLLDLEQVVLVVPGGRAGRQLLEILVETADRRSLVLSPPRIETVGSLPELLYESKQPFATDLVQQLTWVHALRSLGRRRIQRYIPQLPPDEDVVRWLDLGRLLWRQHRELASDGLDFDDVVQHESRTSRFPEQARWRFLRSVQKTYLAMLDKLGLWDVQTARLFAIDHEECRTDRDIVLVATVDMNRAMRQMLEQVAERVTVIVHAPESKSHLFDEHGCLLADDWQHEPIGIDSGQVRVVDGPADQADAVARSIADYDARYRADEIIIGIPDERIVPQIERQLGQCDVPTRWVVGRRLPETAPFQLLAAVGRYAERGRFGDLAALIRHPDVADWLDRRTGDADWLSQVDRYCADHLQPKPGEWLGEPEDNEHVREVFQLLQTVMRDLTGEARKLDRWTQPILDVLLEFYGDVELNRDEPAGHFALNAAAQIHDALAEFRSVPPRLLPKLSATDAIQMLLDRISSGVVPPLPDDEVVAMLGWLELPLDHSPALIVTSLNESFVPKSVNADLFLPNSLRRRLGLVDNARRYARDAYALSVLLASREKLTLIVARKDTNGDPLIPSRLLFACDSETIAKRALDFFSPPQKALDQRPLVSGTQNFADRPDSGTASSGFVVPPPVRTAPLRAISVTAFRNYLACPYRFYLRHVLKLDAVDDRAEELNAPAFGVMLHDVLTRFGRSELRDSRDVAEIDQFLQQSLEECANETLGEDRLPAVRVQLRQMQVRLGAFAAWQAEWAGQGWRIEHTEVPETSKPLNWEVANGSIGLFGRIDRIDRHQETGEWLVFDYKTSDTAKTPEQIHLRGDQWTDLQLPLYRHIARQVGVQQVTGLGYIVLPKDTARTGALLAEWSAGDLENADRTVSEIVERILDQQFWPPADPPPRILSDFGAICQDSVFERTLGAPAEAIGETVS